ncbi:MULTISPECIES: DNA polymerase III subunit gamma/tau [Bacillus cereus group]|uniref:DNA-directed DNA polymerase n=1 Tax=Bacillus thuringiensis serovar mexicanensis TaxID=180868 RepID=A0A242WBW4_BACTU|nr:MULTISPECIES: DNA polymerase III subunit gamma/tau [Bacillus cereus group]MEB9673997.1 DNA polymerase III subunit gamma/tau [Bacillus anthracis]OTW50825.1 DNA polymerase III subunit gamma/tau [Bacillus thuringiensis serovar mexicanensis]OTX09510.1 DNA polymerase III subunit gamma/tau [Bacillus thuringiensis serovar monterrey]
MYQALYRKYRPTNFIELIGQNHIKQTIQNALKLAKFSHAYMFTGPRGTGKTTIAKLIATSLNCENLNNEGEPCNECSQCKAIRGNSHADVLEIDAASNNGVEQIREIREQVAYAPGTGKYKVYIIDEVHMLSTGAFNALLKTLEEPPKHVIFILATTDVHKVPTTIISRCQRFDFRRIGPRDIIERLRHVAIKEEVKIEEEALQLLGMLAQGGMRDALSLMDQTIAFATNETITKDDVSEVVGRISIEKIEACIGDLLKGNTIEILNLINQVILNGKEPIYLLEDLIGYLRDLVISKAFKVQEDNITTAILNNKFYELLEEGEIHKMQMMIRKLTEVKNEMKFSNNAQVSLEVGLIQLATEAQEENRLIRKINELEKRVRELTGSGSVPVRPKSLSPTVQQPAEEKVDITEYSKKTLNKAIDKMSIIATDNYVLDIVFPDAQKDYKVQYQGELATIVKTLLDKQTKLISFKHLLDKMSIAIASSTSVVIGADAYLIEVLSENEVYKELTNIMQKNIKRLVDIKFVTEEKWKPLVNKMIQLTKEKRIHA